MILRRKLQERITQYAEVCWVKLYVGQKGLSVVSRIAGIQMWKPTGFVKNANTGLKHEDDG
jgi:hypothetical protein